MDSGTIMLIFIALVVVLVFVRRLFFRAFDWVANRIPSGNWLLGGFGGFLLALGWPILWAPLVFAVVAVALIWIGHENSPDLAKYKRQIESVLGPISLTTSKVAYLRKLAEQPVQPVQRPPDPPKMFGGFGTGLPH